MATPNSTWTDERIAELKRLVDRGFSCREIADEIGVSRNAVIGKISRLQLARPYPQPRGRRAEPKAAPKDPGVAVVRLRKVLALMRTAATADISDKPVASVIPLAPRCSLLELNNETCRWPVGNQPADIRFCGDRPLDGLPYCAGHARMAYRVSVRR